MCRSGGRRCPACDEPSTANRHNFVRRAKSQGLSVATLAAQVAETEIAQMSADDNVVEAAEQITQATPKKSLRELLAEKQAAATPAVSAKERRRAASAASTQWSRHGFAGSEQPRVALPGNFEGASASPKDQQMISESTRWSDSLTSAHREAVDRYSIDGAGIINRKLHTGSALDRQDQQSIKLLDEAIDSVGLSEQARVVYRGITCPAGVLGEEWAEVDFPVGAEVSFPGYLSTSDDPGLADNFSSPTDPSRSIVFEIKTRQGAPMAALSKWGNAERERLLPREVSARVVGVQYDVPFQGRDILGRPTTRLKTVIQLVEMSAWEE